MNLHLITELKQAFIYNPDTGAITRKKSIVRSNGRPTHYKIGGRVGSEMANGYVSVSFTTKIGKVSILAHRLAFILMGHDLPDMVDHINGQRADNRWENLRASSNSNNQLNRHVKCGKDKDLPIGVYRRVRRGRPGVWFDAKLQIGAKVRSSSFRKKEDAIKRIREWRLSHVNLKTI